MARYPAIRLGAVRELGAQQRFTPPETLRRQVERIEKLSREIEEGASYPSEWVLFRVTGYRSDTGGTLSESLSGKDLLADLPALAERISAGADISWEECVRDGALGMDALAAKWGVSRKTVERQRTRGLVARRVVGPGGRPQLLYMPASVRAHEAKFADSLARAGGFTRISGRDEERILKRAARYRRVLGSSAHDVAKRLAPRFGRSAEAVRLLIERRLAVLFTKVARLSAGDRHTAWLAWRAGADFGQIARLIGRPGDRATARRAVHAERARLLKRLKSSGRLGAGLDVSEDALGKLLAPEPARVGLGASGETDLLLFVEDARKRRVSVAYEERVRAAAYQGLRAWARGAIERLDPHNPGAAELDAIESRLLYAARLKAELVRSQLPLMVQTLEGVLGERLDQLTALVGARLRTLIEESVEAVGDAADGFDPPVGGKSAGIAGRLAASASLAVTRIATSARSRVQASAAISTRRATQRPMPGAVMKDWTRQVCPWQEWLEGPSYAKLDASTTRIPEPPHEHDRRTSKAVRLGRKRGGELISRGEAFLSLRFGWSGEPPMTLAACASRLGISERAAATLEREVLRRAIAGHEGRLS